MQMISVRDNKNNRWMRNAKKKKTNKKKQIKTKTEKKKGNGSYRENMRAKWFSWAFKFLTNEYRRYLIFKSKLELTLSIILKERKLYESKHVPVECRCLKIWHLLYFLICFSILVLKWRQVSPI